MSILRWFGIRPRLRPSLRGRRRLRFWPDRGRTFQRLPPRLGIGIDMLLDGLLAHSCAPLQPRAAADDLRRPAFPEPRLRVGPHFRRESARPRPAGPRLRLRMRLLRAVAPLPAVPADLAAEAAGGTPQPPPHLSRPETFLTPTVYEPTLFPGHALVSHHAPCVLRIRRA